jgi:hypothetical protein
MNARAGGIWSPRGLHHFDEQDPDPHGSEKLYPDLDRTKVMRIRNPRDKFKLLQIVFSLEAFLAFLDWDPFSIS